MFPKKTSRLLSLSLQSFVLFLLSLLFLSLLLLGVPFVKFGHEWKLGVDSVHIINVQAPVRRRFQFLLMVLTLSEHVHGGFEVINGDNGGHLFARRRKGGVGVGIVIWIGCLLFLFEFLLDLHNVFHRLWYVNEAARRFGVEFGIVVPIAGFFHIPGRRQVGTGIHDGHCYVSRRGWYCGMAVRFCWRAAGLRGIFSGIGGGYGCWCWV
mmetsp:Transcript_19840/g.47248  ORF Transcript_19840/g.47248 Transcript_19840/m.47248 type:complete len:209 (-) Transcript_19840:191-817(-)